MTYRVPPICLAILLLINPLIPLAAATPRAPDPPGIPSVRVGAFGNLSGLDDLFSEYHTYETMLMLLKEMEVTYPDIVRLYDLTERADLGRTYEGRSVWAVKVSKGAGAETDYYDDPDKPNVLIFGAHHAREWMSYEVCLYTLLYLVRGYGRNNADNDGDGLLNEDRFDGADNDGDGKIDEDPSEGRVNFLVDNREIWIIPMVNPDGVAYDHTISEPGRSGGWRKNLRDNNRNDRFDPEWDGVDLNRNYPYMWWTNRKIVRLRDGVVRSMDSANPASDVYRGPPDTGNQDGDFGPAGLTPRINEDPVDGEDNDRDGMVDEDRDGGFTEPETQALGRLVKTFDDQGDTGEMPFAASISYHSVAGLVLWPWGYTIEETPHKELFEEVGGELGAITDYEPMQAVDLYPTAGDSEDWLYGSGNVLAFTIELEGPNGGFHPAVEHIVPINKKALAANLYLFDVADKIEIAKQYRLPVKHSVLGLEVVNRDPVVRADEELVVQCEVIHPEKMIPGSLSLRYSIGPGTYEGIDMEFDPVTGYYTARLESVPPNSKVSYYVRAEDISGITVTAPSYGEYDPHIVNVVPEKGLSSLENILMLMMMFIILLIVWGGFVGLILMAMKAERRKSGIPA